MHVTLLYQIVYHAAFLANEFNCRKIWQNQNMVVANVMFSYSSNEKRARDQMNLIKL